jgi:hypothetical protein
MTAQADWQYTKWGMTVEQALRASGDQLHLPAIQEQRVRSAGDRQPELVGQHATTSFRFSVALFFGALPRSGLDLVVLRSEDRSRKQIDAIIQSLRGLYGEPVESKVNQMAKIYRWRDD